MTWYLQEYCNHLHLLGYQFMYFFYQCLFQSQHQYENPILHHQKQIYLDFLITNILQFIFLIHFQMDLFSISLLTFQQFFPYLFKESDIQVILFNLMIFCSPYPAKLKLYYLFQFQVFLTNFIQLLYFLLGQHLFY